MHPLWSELFSKAGATLRDAQDAALHRYLDLLLEGNATMNLTRIADRAVAEEAHVGDALTLLPFLPAGAHRVVDVGSGGGVPGIPLAIARPDATVVLVESTQKKAAFLQAAVAALGLTNVTVSARRAEDEGNSSSRESFDVAVARAVALMNVLAEWCLPLVKKGGRFLAMKGPRVVDELPAAARAIRLLGGAAPIIHATPLPGASGHVIVEIPKIAKTPPSYPRSPTNSSRRPL